MRADIDFNTSSARHSVACRLMRMADVSRQATYSASDVHPAKRARQSCLVTRGNKGGSYRQAVTACVQQRIEEPFRHNDQIKSYNLPSWRPSRRQVRTDMSSARRCTRNNSTVRQVFRVTALTVTQYGSVWKLSTHSVTFPK